MASKSKEEQLKDEIIRIKDDFDVYREKNLKIKDKSGAIVPFEPNTAQQKLIEYVLEQLSRGLPVRVIILKSRQMGFSTAVEALIYWWTATHKNINSIIIAHDNAASKNLYNMFKRYYEHSLDIFKPARKYDTKSDLTFAREDGGGLNSSIKTATADNTSTGRSDTAQLLHCSEVGQWRNGEEIVASLFQTVPLLPNTMIFLESTAQGVGNYFYEEWQAAKKGDSVFYPFFFSWWEHDEYELNGNIDRYTPEEEELIKLFEKNNIPKHRWDRKLSWRRFKVREFNKNPDLFKQEYPATELEAFLASGRPRFDVGVISEMLEEVREPQYIRLSEGQKRTIDHEIVSKSPLKVWEMPQRDTKYTIGVDVSEGVGQDYSVVDVMDTTLRTVARFRGQIDPDLLGNEVDKIGRWYNNALVGVEINNHGLTTVQRLRDLFYTNLYRREKGYEELFEESTSKLGWKTDIKTKPLMIDKMAQMIREQHLVDYDEVFLRECLSYVVDDSGKTNAQAGGFDDTVIAKAINVMMYDWQFLDTSRIKIHKPIKFMSKKHGKI